MNGFLESPEFQAALKTACGWALADFGSGQSKYDIEDLENEVRMRIVTSGDQYRREATLRTYLFNIARNLLVDAFRFEHAKKRDFGQQVIYTDRQWESIVGESGRDIDDQILLEECLAKLSEDDRYLYEQWFEMGVTSVSLAKELDLSATTVTQRVKRVLFMVWECCNS